MYRVIGADQREYGPISAEQVRDWIRDGRLDAHSIGRTEEMVAGKPLNQFPEFAPSFVSIPPLSPLSPTRPVTAPKASGMATASLVMGIMTIVCCCGPVTGILGIVFGWITLADVRERANPSSKTMAIIGIVLSGVGMLGTLLAWGFGFMNEAIRHFTR